MEMQKKATPWVKLLVPSMGSTIHWMFSGPGGPSFFAQNPGIGLGRQ